MKENRASLNVKNIYREKRTRVSLFFELGKSSLTYTSVIPSPDKRNRGARKGPCPLITETLLPDSALGGGLPLTAFPSPLGAVQARLDQHPSVLWLSRGQRPAFCLDAPVGQQEMLH